MIRQWILTDPDAAQYVRQGENLSVWECMQVAGNDQIGYGIPHAWIDLVNDYTDQEIDDVMRMYYGCAWQKDLSDLSPEDRQRTIAECIFETEYGMPTAPKYKTFEEAAQVVRSRIGV